MLQQKSDELREEGNTLFKQGNYQHAVVCYEQATKECSTNIKAWSNLAICHKKLGNIQKAITTFEHVLALDLQHEKALNNLVDIYRKNLDKSPEFTRKAFAFRQQYQAKVCFLSVDFKLTSGGRLVLLELTRGLQSGYRGFEQHGRKLKDMLQQATKATTIPELIMTDDFGHQCIDKLLAQKVKQQTKSNEKFAKDIRKLSSYKNCYFEFEFPAMPIGCPILPIDDLNVDHACENKHIFHQACERASQLELRPKSFIIDRSKPYSNTLLQQIKSQVGEHKKYVIKGPGQEESSGVIIVTSDQLPELLPRLFLPIERAVKEYFETDPQQMRAFHEKRTLPPELNILTDNTGCFLVEEYVANKPITKEGKLYDPTGRIFFFVTRDSNSYKYTFIDGYWRLPDNSINDRSVSMRDKVIPSFNQFKPMVVALNADDKALINTKLNLAMPAIAKDLITHDFLAEFASKSPNNVKSYHYLHYSNGAGTLGDYGIAEYCLVKAREIISPTEQYRVFHELGIIRTRQGKYAEAITHFDKAISLNAQSEISHIRRGIAHHLMGNVAQCRRDLAKGAKVNPRRVQVLANEYGIDISGI